MWPLNDLDAILNSIVEGVDVLGVRVEIHFATVLRTGPAARAKHHFAGTERHHRETQAALTVVIGHRDIEPDLAIPVDGLSHVWYVEHWNDLLLHGLTHRGLGVLRHKDILFVAKTIAAVFNIRLTGLFS